VGVVVLGNVDDRLVEPGRGEPPLSIPYAILRHFAKLGFHTGIASLAGGLAPAPAPGAGGRSPIPTVSGDERPEQILRAITPLLQSSEARVAIAIRHPSHFALAGDHPLDSHLACGEILYAWGVDERIRRSGSFVVLLDPEDRICDLVRGHTWGFKLIRAGYPPVADREAFVGGWLGRRRPSFEPSVPARVARLMGGLRLVEIEALLRGAEARREELSDESVRAERVAKIGERLVGIAEVKEPSIGWGDVGGLAHVKDHFQEVARSARRGPRGLTGSTLLAGVPGVGKSFTAEALARELHVPIVFVRNLYDQWMGSSEARVERLVETLAAFDGCVCVFEEVDQLLGRRDGGPSSTGGTTERVRGRLMEFMGGSYPGIHFVGMTNRPDLLDIANQDRFSVLIPVLHPGLRERIQLLPALFAQEGREAEPDVDFAAVAQHSNLGVITVRGLRDIVRMAGRLADREGDQLGAAVGLRHLLRVIATFRPKLDPQEVELIALTAVAGCQFQAYLPWMSWEGRRKDVDVPPYLHGIVDPESGAVDDEALRRRLGELGARRGTRGGS
jgi:SpoVK/Ycf46/Vps4 family AAA+-type ATPase